MSANSIHKAKILSHSPNGVLGKDLFVYMVEFIAKKKEAAKLPIKTSVFLMKVVPQSYSKNFINMRNLTKKKYTSLVVRLSGLEKRFIACCLSIECLNDLKEPKSVIKELREYYIKERRNTLRKIEAKK